MSITTSTSCHISPQSFMVVHASPTFPLPTSNLTSKARSGSMSLATSSGPVRRVIPRSSSVSIPSPSPSTSWYPIMPVHTHHGVGVFLDAQGGVHDPFFGGLDLSTSRRLLHLEYLSNGASDREICLVTHSTKNHDRKENYDVNDGHENVTSTTATSQSIPLRRTRTRSTRQDRQEPVTIPIRSTSLKEKEAIFGEAERKLEQTRRLEGIVEISPRNPLATRHAQPQSQQQHQKPAKMNFWEAEVAAKKDLEEDDYAWYYRNPQRHVWRPRNARKRTQRRKRVMCGVATGEEGAPTNRSLFATYVQQHFPSTLLLPPVGFGTEPEPSPEASHVKSPTRRNVNANGLVIDRLLAVGYLEEGEEWQEDLFSPDERGPSSRSRRNKCASRSSSLLCSEYSHLSDSSANSTQQTIHEDTVFQPGCLS